MKAADFDRWWADLIVRFPSVESWLMKAAHGDQNHQRQLLRNWCIVFQDVELADAIEVNQQMQAGDMAWVGEYDSDREKLPQHVRRLARQLAWERDGSIEQNDLPPLGEQGTGFPAKKILQRWAELQRGGMDRDAAREQALSEFPAGSPRIRECVFSCLDCLDSGRVHVASNSAIQAMLIGEFHKCHHRDAMMRCRCKLGSRLKRKLHGREVPWESFNASLDFKVRDPLWAQAEVDRFALWAYAKKDASAADRAKACANYDRAFDSWNERADIA